jgi:hypothetical protein
MGVELGRISGPLLEANLLRNGIDLAFETELLYLKVSGTTDVPFAITSDLGTTLFSFTSDSVTLSKEFYSQGLVDSLVGQIAVIDRYPNPPLFYTVVSIETEPLAPTLWRMTVDTTFNTAGLLKPISFYPDVELTQIVTNDIWDTTGNSVGEKWVAYYKTGLPPFFATTVEPGWTINVAGTIYVVDYIIEDPVNTNMWRIYVTTSLVAGVGIPIFSSSPLTVPVINTAIGINTDAPSRPLTTNGTLKTTNLVVDTSLSTPGFYVTTNRIQNLIDDIVISPNQTLDPKIVATKFATANLRISDQLIENITNGSDINLTPNGIGQIIFNTDELVINGNLDVTGSVSWDGSSITIGSSDQDNVEFNAEINSHIVPNIHDTYDLGTVSKQWNRLYTDVLDSPTVVTPSLIANGIDLLLTQGNTWYVSVNGADANQGDHLHATFRTVKYALSQATAGDEIVIFPGTYQEIFPLTVPSGVTVRGMGIRAVAIEPTVDTENNDCFLLNGETTIEFLTVQNFFAPGYAFKLAPNYLATTKSPYIYNVTVLTKGSGASTELVDGEYSYSFIESILDGGSSSTATFDDSITGGVSTSLFGAINPNDPLGFAQGDAGGGAFIDGSVADPACAIVPSMLFYSATFIVPNAQGLVLTNKARCEWLNSFTYFAQTGIKLQTGTTGFAEQGDTKLVIGGLVGTISVGDTFTYYEPDDTTVIASGTVIAVDGDNLILDGFIPNLITIDEAPTTQFTKTGTAAISESRFKFGGASLSLTGASYLSTPDSFKYHLNGSDFCIEAWIYPEVFPAVKAPIIAHWGATPAEQSFRIDLSTGGGIRIEFNDGANTVLETGIEYLLSETGEIITTEAGDPIISEGSAIILDAWQHIAVSRSGDVVTLYINGFTKLSTTLALGAVINNATNDVTFGHVQGESEYFNGHIDEIRLSKNTPRFTTDFTLPTTEYLPDTDTYLLMHLNGINGSVNFVDESFIQQNIHFTSGVATRIESLDYSDFGAEIRSINSANVYGTYGAVAEGRNTLGYLIGHNFGYVGTNANSQNDQSLVVQANEVVEISYGVIYYDSVDHKGDYRIGDVFYVNQETGQVVFDSQAIDFTANGELVLEGPTSTTIINAFYLQTGNIRLYNNNVDSLVDDVNLRASNNILNISTDVIVTGNLDVTGNLAVDGNVFIGNDALDTVAFLSKISQTVIPDVSGLTLGDVDNVWDTVFAGLLNVDNVTEINNNTISILSSDTDLVMVAAGTGIVNIAATNVQINEDLTIGGTLRIDGASTLQPLDVTGNIIITGDIGQTVGDTFITGTFANNNIIITGNSYFEVPDIRIFDNDISVQLTDTDLVFTANGSGGVVFDNTLKITSTTISNVKSPATTNAEKSIILAPNGTGILVIDTATALQIPVGSNTNRILSTDGEIRFNSTYNNYEGFDRTGLVSFNGLYSQDRDTYIIPELSIGNNDNTLTFATNNVVRTTIDSTKLYSNSILVDTISISENTISSTQDLELVNAGTGSTIINDIPVKDGTITNTEDTAIIIGSTPSSANNGWVKFGGDAVVFPYGPTEDRRATPEVGEIRSNSTLGFSMEVYSGDITQGDNGWIPAVGTSGAATQEQIEETLNLYAIVLG